MSELVRRRPGTTSIICPTCGSVVSPSWPSRPRKYCSLKCMSRPLADRFWQRVNKTEGCWLWTGSLNPHGYGQLSQGIKGRRPLITSRVSWEIHNGPIPDGLHVLHHCDVPACVRPDHLFLGRPRDNALDKVAKGRARGGSLKGEKHPHAKLTEEQVRAIRADPRGSTTVSRAYGVTKSTIQNIRNGRSWNAK
jgi:hypothetical protein